ncbi:MAG TPA: DUF222 domain-containing protein [Propionicimonas sp.]|uniref:DUF222 domain-containing protein n=1 Tax=Propionicimonas sp. TaxID=1955623 RepID=UPI002F41E227
MIELRGLRGMPLPEAMGVLLDARATRRAAEVQEAVAILHIVENYHRDLPENPMPGRGRLVELAAEGGPKLNEFVPLELSAALGVSQQSITLLICDLLDLEYRHPRLWEQVCTCETPLWQARKIAQRTASVELSLEAALELDRQLSPTLPGLTVGRSLKLLEGLIATVDPRGAEQRAEAERRKRWVRIQPTTDGVSWLDGKLACADGRQLDTTLNRIAAVLKANGDTDDRDARRASALGVLSNPALALALLHRDRLRRTSRRRASRNARGLEEADRPARLTPDPDGSDVPAPDVLAGVPASLLAELASIDLKKLLPTSTLFLHLSDRAVRNENGVCRVEGIGAVPVKQLRRLLKGTRVRVQPVFDPETVPPVDSYEIPAPMRRAVLLRQPSEVFPFGSWPSRNLDLDHTDPYRFGTGERGQTRVDNLGPLTRRSHRAKTHTGWQVKQVLPGCYLWRSPLGLTYLRTADGLTYALRRTGPPKSGGIVEEDALSA